MLASYFTIISVAHRHKVSEYMVYLRGAKTWLGWVWNMSSNSTVGIPTYLAQKAGAASIPSCVPS